MGASKACPAVSTPQEFALLTHSASTWEGTLPGGVTPSDRRAEGDPSPPACCVFPRGQGQRPMGPVDVLTSSQQPFTTFCTWVLGPYTDV